MSLTASVWDEGVISLEGAGQQPGKQGGVQHTGPSQEKAWLLRNKSKNCPPGSQLLTLGATTTAAEELGFGGRPGIFGLIQTEAFAGALVT